MSQISGSVGRHLKEKKRKGVKGIPQTSLVRTFGGGEGVETLPYWQCRELQVQSLPGREASFYSFVPPSGKTGKATLSKLKD